MSTDLARLIEELTLIARKEPELVETEYEVDVHFGVVLVDQSARERRAEIVAAIEASGLDLKLFRKGPSYIEVGAALGSQQLALQLFGLGEAAGLWRVITPARLGVTGADGHVLAGRGYVMISGYRP
jgi:hypothetical protein